VVYLGTAGTGFFVCEKRTSATSFSDFQVGGYSDDGWDITTNPRVIRGLNLLLTVMIYGTQSRTLYVGVAAAAKFHLEIGKQK